LRLYCGVAIPRLTLSAGSSSGLMVMRFIDDHPLEVDKVLQ